MIKEEFLNENFTGEQPVTGLDVAKLVGAEDIYKKGKQQEEMDSQMKIEAKKRFSNMVTRMNEINKRNQKDIID